MPQLEHVIPKNDSCQALEDRSGGRPDLASGRWDRLVKVLGHIRLQDWATAAVVVLAWEVTAGVIFPHIYVASQNIFPAPLTVLSLGITMLSNGELISHSLVSLQRVVIGFCFAVGVAVPLGLSMGAWPSWRRQMEVVINVLRPIPPLGWIPFGLYLFGIGDEQSYFIIALSAAFPILMNTVHGVMAVEPVLQRSALCLGANRRQLFRYVMLPRALPNILLGMRMGLGFAWMVLVASEFVGATSGLGFLILYSRNAGFPSLAFLGMLMIGMIGFFLDVGLRAIERKLTPWR